MNRSGVINHLIELSRSGRNELIVDEELLSSFLYSRSMREFFEKARAIYIQRKDFARVASIDTILGKINIEGEQKFGEGSDIAIGIIYKDFLRKANQGEVAAQMTNDAFASLKNLGNTGNNKSNEIASKRIAGKETAESQSYEYSGNNNGSI
jgi:hypothetical protein